MNEHEAMIDESLASDHDDAVRWARDVLADPKTVVLDSETTGLHNAEMVEVAVVDRQGEVAFESRIRPEVPVEDGARAVHGISDEALAIAPPFPRILPDLHEAIKDKRVVVYNAEFDGPIYESMLVKHGYAPVRWLMWTPAWHSWECAMRRYAAFVGDRSEHHGDYRFQRLPGADHTAAGDAKACLYLLQDMAETVLPGEAPLPDLQTGPKEV